jgi:uncharacterized small protein (DUF1192 family)
MDGKAKKRLEVIKQKLQLLQRNLEQQIAALQAEATKLRA